MNIFRYGYGMLLMLINTFLFSVSLNAQITDSIIQVSGNVFLRVEDLGWVTDTKSLSGVLQIINESNETVTLNRIRGNGGNTYVNGITDLGTPTILPHHSAFIAYRSSMIKYSYISWDRFATALTDTATGNRAKTIKPVIPLNMDVTFNKKVYSIHHDYDLKKKHIRAIKADNLSSEYQKWLCDFTKQPAAEPAAESGDTLKPGFSIVSYGDSICLLESSITFTNHSANCIRLIKCTSSDPHGSINLWSNSNSKSALNEYAIIPAKETVLIQYRSNVISKIFNNNPQSFLAENHQYSIQIDTENSNGKTERKTQTIIFSPDHLNQIIKK